MPQVFDPLGPWFFPANANAPPGCRWVNLWLPLSSSLIPESCAIADPEALMDDGVFLGNTAFVFGILVAIFLVHVAVISAVEAYWLAQARGAQLDLWYSILVKNRQLGP